MDSSESDRLSQTSIAGLTRASLIMRLAAIGVVIAGIAGLFAYAGGWLTPHNLSPASMINRFEQVNGLHPGFRRNHAKGVCFAGYFESNGRGVALSKASVFVPGRVPIIGRFSLAGGQPYVADAPRAIRGMGILFQMPDGEEWRTAMINIPVFTVNTPQGFYDQLLRGELDPATGKPDSSRMSAFLIKHPESAKAMQWIRSHPPSSGFENSTFNGLNAFRFINATGKVVPVRWSMVSLSWTGARTRYSPFGFESSFVSSTSGFSTSVLGSSVFGVGHRGMRFRSRSRMISVWNNTALRWARYVKNRRYARIVRLSFACRQRKPYSPFVVQPRTYLGVFVLTKSTTGPLDKSGL